MNTHAPLRRSRIATTLVAIGVTAVSMLVACSSPPSEARKLAVAFTTALNAHSAPAAAALTTDAADAETTITGMFSALGPDGRFFIYDVDDDGDHSTIAITGDWELTLSGQKFSWRYDTTAMATKTDHGWKLSWNPAMLVPKLANGGTLSPSLVLPKPVNVVDRNNKPILVQHTVTQIRMAAGTDTEALAALLSPIDATITSSTLDAQLAGSKGQPVTAVSLRETDLDPIAHKLEGMPGITLAPEQKLLYADNKRKSAALKGLVDLWGTQWLAALGWRVDVFYPSGKSEQLGYGPPAEVSDIHTTLDPGVFNAAEDAVSGISNAAAIVALKPSTGEVLALAQNNAADGQGPIANNGLYPPGSTFKIITAYSALASGAVTPDTVVNCPGTASIKGRTIPNADNFDLGKVRLRTAFAKSCNTTFAQLAGNLDSRDLTNTAAKLGLGVNYSIPGMITVTGAVPIPDVDAERVEDGIGQGKVTASPFGMAMVGASIANGFLQAPVLVAGQPGTPDQTPDSLDASLCNQIRTMMRETITDGTATDLLDIPGLMGKTGTAEYGDGQAHGWFVGIVGDMAFAVLVVGADSSQPAKDLTGEFLRALKH